MEIALTLASTEYCTYGIDKILHKQTFLDMTVAEVFYNPLELLTHVQKDNRFNSIVSIPTIDIGIQTTVDTYQDIIIDYTKSLNITADNIDTVLQELLHMTVLVSFKSYIDYDTKKNHANHISLLVQLLPALHAIIEIGTLVTNIHNHTKNRNKIQRFIEKNQVVVSESCFLTLVKNYWVFFIAVYITVGRPSIGNLPIEVTLSEMKDKQTGFPNEDEIWGEIIALLLEAKHPEKDEKKYDGTVFIMVRSLLFASRYLCGFKLSYFYAKLAWIMATGKTENIP